MWASKRQTSTSRSTIESEVVSLAAALFAEAPFAGEGDRVSIEIIRNQDNYRDD